MYRRILLTVMTVAIFLAQIGSASACFINGYQAPVPKSLVK